MLGEGPSGRSVSVRVSWFRVEAQQPPPQRYTQFRLPDAPRHPRGHGGCALSCPQRVYPMTSTTHPSLEDGGQIEVLMEKSVRNTPIQQRTPTRWSLLTAVTMSFTYLDQTRYLISSSLLSPIVAAGCSHRIQWRKPGQGNCQGDRLCCSERWRNVVDLDELRLGQTVEPRGIPGTWAGHSRSERMGRISKTFA